jgi:hypothetical protein
MLYALRAVKISKIFIELYAKNLSHQKHCKSNSEKHALQNLLERKRCNFYLLVAGYNKAIYNLFLLFHILFEFIDWRTFLSLFRGYQKTCV